MAYSIHGHYIPYILEANSKRPVREKRKEIENKVMLKKLNGPTFFHY